MVYPRIVLALLLHFLFLIWASAHAQPNPSCTNGMATTSSGQQVPCGVYQCNATASACLTACASDNNCASSAFCQGAQCVAKFAAGQPCAASNQCQSGSTCSSGICQAAQTPAKSSGSTTRKTQVCQNGVVTTSTGNKASCGPYACNAAATACLVSCNHNGECNRGFVCTNNQCVVRPR